MEKHEVDAKPRVVDAQPPLPADEREVVAEFEQEVREAVDEGVLASAVKSLLADPARRRAMSARGRALVDGFGAARAAEVVLDRGRTRLPEGQEAPR